MNWLSEADGKNYVDLGEKMFGPNTHFRYDEEISFSHRDGEFMKLFELVSDLFQEKCENSMNLTPFMGVIMSASVNLST